MVVSITNTLLLYVSIFLSSVFFITIKFPDLKGSWIIKGLSIILLSVFAYHNCITEIALLISVSLIFSSIGDIFLGINEEKFFIHGLVAFLVSHILYCIAFYSSFNIHSLSEENHFILNLALILYSITMLKKLLPKLGNLKFPVIIYVCVIFLMGIGAISSNYTTSILVLGALLFIVSDSLLATQKFLKPFLGVQYLIWITYYLGQLFIVFGTLK